MTFIDRFNNMFKHEHRNKLILYQYVDLETPKFTRKVCLIPRPNSYFIRQCFLDHMYLYIVEQDIYLYDVNNPITYKQIPFLKFRKKSPAEEYILGVDDKEDFFYIFTGIRNRYILVCSKTNLSNLQRTWKPFGSRYLFQQFKRMEIFDHYLYLLFDSQIHIYSTNASQESDLLQILSLGGESIENLVFLKNEMYVMTASYPPRIFVFK